jgi:hypothetical protein
MLPLYLLGLAMAALAMPVIGVAGVHLWRDATRTRRALTLSAGLVAVLGGAAVLHSTLDGFGQDERAIDALEIAASGLLPLVALFLSARRLTTRAMHLAASALATLLMASVLDAIGATRLVAGHLPGTGILPLDELAARSLGRMYLVENAYCQNVGHVAISVFGAVPFAALAGLARGPRRSALRWAALAGLLLYAGSMLTRSSRSCECYEAVVPDVPRSEWTRVDCPVW